MNNYENQAICAISGKLRPRTCSTDGDHVVTRYGLVLRPLFNNLLIWLVTPAGFRTCDPQIRKLKIKACFVR